MIVINAVGDLRMDYLIGPIHYLEVLRNSLKVNIFELGFKGQ